MYLTYKTGLADLLNVKGLRKKEEWRKNSMVSKRSIPKYPYLKPHSSPLESDAPLGGVHPNLQSLTFFFGGGALVLELPKILCRILQIGTFLFPTKRFCSVFKLLMRTWTQDKSRTTALETLLQKLLGSSAPFTQQVDTLCNVTNNCHSIVIGSLVSKILQRSIPSS